MTRSGYLDGVREKHGAAQMNINLAIAAARTRLAMFRTLESKASSADYRADYRASRIRMGRLIQRLIERGPKARA